VLETLSAIALCSPTKSDLQQRDIVILTDPAARDKLAGLVDGQEWVGAAPALLVFCGNNRRQRLLHRWKGIPFANDHLDAFFNATVDAAIALGAFVTAAEASGLGCCPISAVRNKPQKVSQLLRLPDHVFPVAGLAVGYPVSPPTIAMRLPLRTTVHRNVHQENHLRRDIEAYSKARAERHPYATQRLTDVHGTSDSYRWIDDKTRQYGVAERDDFGAFIRHKGFRLE
jgi:nitroreductase/FMN reductase [NAD(P)H]